MPRAHHQARQPQTPLATTLRTAECAAMVAHTPSAASTGSMTGQGPLRCWTLQPHGPQAKPGIRRAPGVAAQVVDATATPATLPGPPMLVPLLVTVPCPGPDTDTAWPMAGP